MLLWQLLLLVVLLRLLRLEPLLLQLTASRLSLMLSMPTAPRLFGPTAAVRRDGCAMSVAVPLVRILVIPGMWSWDPWAPTLRGRLLRTAALVFAPAWRPAYHRSAGLCITHARWRCVVRCSAVLCASQAPCPLSLR